jgi:predicted esterase
MIRSHLDKFEIFFIVCLVLKFELVSGQKPIFITLNNNSYNSIKQEIEADQNITADSLIKSLSNWDRYPVSYKADQNYIFNYQDSFFGNVPMRLYVPKTYNPHKKTTLILLLHGAVSISSFSRANNQLEGRASRNESDDDDIFFNYLKNQGYMILRPFADPAKKFNWSINSFNDNYDNASPDDVNLTFSCIIKTILKLKKTFNIDDNKIFAFGHSDGSDGAFGMAIFQPSIFAGFIIYNSMLTNLKAINIYPLNMKNVSTYIVHSDLDDLRPVEQTTAIVDIVKKFDANIEYKVYKGYKHFDNHLKIDLPFANKYILKTVRTPFLSHIYWESSNNIDNQCFWLKVDRFDLNLPKEEWQHEINLKSFRKTDKTWEDFNYYFGNVPGYAINAFYENNTFTIDCSKVLSFEILISDKMVDFKRPIKVYLNKKIVFNKSVKPNRQYIASSFEKYFDRDCIWVNSIRINVDPVSKSK